MDHQVLGNSMSDNPTEIQNVPAESLSSNGTDIPYEASNQDIASTDISSQGRRSNLPLLNNDSLNEFNCEAGLTPINGGVPRLDEGHSKAITTISPANVDFDLNCDHVDNEQSFLQASNNGISSQNSGSTAFNAVISSQFVQSEPSLQTSNVVVPRPLRILSNSSSSGPGSSSTVGQHFLQNDGSRHAIPYGHSLSLKRKNVEVAPGPSATSGSSSRPGHPSHEDINEQANNTNQAITSGNGPSGNGAGNEEILQRNIRMRLRLPHTLEASSPSIWPQGNGISYPNNSSAHHSVSRPIPSDPLLVSSHAANNGYPYVQSHAPNIDLSSNVHPFTLNGAPVARLGSSISRNMSGGMSEIEETRLRTLIRNITARRLAMGPSPNSRPVNPETINLGLASGTAGVYGDVFSTPQSGSNIGVLLQDANSAPSQHHLDLVQMLHVHPHSSSSELRGSSVNLHHLNHSPTLDENASNNQIGMVPHVRQQPAMRSSHLISGQNDGVFGTPIPSSLTVARERRRMRAELRNMFDQIRRAEIPPQGILLFDRAIFLGGADFLDRHRDLRLDVDNMSYEELLALGEQIGNVNTGLTEETIRNCLSPSKFVSVMESSSKEVEPCCICQEDYLEGEETGQLGCGHVFHKACIEQWLKIKNLCPICKTAASSS